MFERTRDARTLRVRVRPSRRSRPLAAQPPKGSPRAVLEGGGLPPTFPLTAAPDPGEHARVWSAILVLLVVLTFVGVACVLALGGGAS
ncbi:MAG: hypothetical protein JOZ99_10840 [Actinobacteria bacterium]|nr:hypothetical protein [Actinomycetota bacterium]